MATKRPKFRVTLFKGSDGKWYWRAQARNWKVIGASEQGYTKKAYALKKALKAYPKAEVKYA